MHSIGSEVAFEGAKKNIWKRTTCNMQNEESHTIRNHTKLLTFDRAVGQLDSQISNTIHTIYPEHSEWYSVNSIAYYSSSVHVTQQKSFEIEDHPRSLPKPSIRVSLEVMNPSQVASNQIIIADQV